MKVALSRSRGTLIGAGSRPRRAVRPSLRTRRALASAALLALLAGTGCLTMPVEPLGEEVNPETLAQDEEHLWKQSNELAYRLDHSGMRLEDPALDAYLTGVARALVGDRLVGAEIVPQVRVLSNPDMNAFSFPTGVVYVHTALLARMENEAQLATMLSREYAHVMARHALMKHRSDRATGNMLAASSLALSSVQGGSYAQLMLKAGAFSSMGGYSWALELAADRMGLEMMDRLGYDLNEAPKLFEITVAYLEEVSRQRTKAPALFAMSQTLHVNGRIDSYRKLIASDFADAAAAADRVRNEDEFRRRINGAVIHQAALELDRGCFDSAAITIERALEVDPRSAESWVILGEARERSKQGADFPGAVEAYEQALAVDRDHARAHRALGLLYYRDGRRARTLGDRREAAREHFARYLEVAPDAPDAGHVRAYLAELDGAGGETSGGGR